MRATFLAVLALAISVSARPSPFGRGRFGDQGFRHGFGNQGGQGKGQQGSGGAAATAIASSAAATASAASVDNAAGANSSVAATAATASAAAASVAASNATAAANTTDTANSTATATSGSNSTDIQSSLTLDPSVIATGFANDGQDVPTAGQVASLTSTNNFIKQVAPSKSSFCAGQTITNGKQITTGSCNPAPMGQLAPNTTMPSAKFVFPKNFDNTSIKANTPFTVQLAIKNLQTGNFVNAQENYFAAPQQVNSQGIIIGHSHIVIEHLDKIDQTAPTDPASFAYFKGLNAPADANGIISQVIDKGLPGGVYKISTINSAANHQPALVSVAQHGSLDDAVYQQQQHNQQQHQQASFAAYASTTRSWPDVTTSTSTTSTAGGSPTSFFPTLSSPFYPSHSSPQIPPASHPHPQPQPQQAQDRTAGAGTTRTFYPSPSSSSSDAPAYGHPPPHPPHPPPHEPYADNRAARDGRGSGSGSGSGSSSSLAPVLTPLSTSTFAMNPPAPHQQHHSSSSAAGSPAHDFSAMEYWRTGR
ncbi:hypothetical protein PUNSTDRAFT_126386 [Punctularia strigosozonata HHB-11173 SS5]|uniref:uncharacterized protein n=1 Tax=Punctularia strigosozonata (strain HHB-11173) TaxID=741275 RepID=UPI000441721D|nr:uncharacterized protein PUNSTDRAFT_126386 [Punctularia strigosozonata HHB-11173 SS5]EIN08287.1 hypothetical protein PUNSTDRAFT_126386 [Punctularia strigosozonata HHB-11173 SS5]